jgi:putative transposase
MSRITRTRRSADQWRKLISEQTDSGLSQEAFCKHKRLALSTFANWKRRLGSEPAVQGERAPDPSTWIDLGSVGVGSSGWDIELDLGDGICLRLRRG